MAGLGEGRSKDYQDDLDSEFDSSEKPITWRDDPLSHKSVGWTMGGAKGVAHSTSLPSKQVLVDERDREELRSRRYHLLSLDAYSRHKTIINRYLLSTGKTIKQIVRSTEGDRNDFDVLREEHRFVWTGDLEPSSWEQRLAKTYYDKLFKEYAISDLSRYKENKVALRWRTEPEVIEGKGQFICGNRRCEERKDLASWEVNFGYMERGEKMNTLVKLRLCPSCSKKLNYHHAGKLWKRKHKEERKSKKRKRTKKGKKEEYSSSDSNSNSDSSQEETDDRQTEQQEDEAQTVEGQDMAKIWNKTAKELVERTKEEEFDDYFKDMFM